MSDGVAYADLYDLSRKAGLRIEEREGKLPSEIRSAVTGVNFTG